MTSQKAIRYRKFGNPPEVLRLETVEQHEPQEGEVRVRLLAATINPSDYGMINGSYGSLRDLPAVAGREGVGEVEAIGPGVEGVNIGKRVRFTEFGAWQERVCMRANELFEVPEDIPVDQAAISFINPPTAYCLLKKMVDLQPGSWIVQNAGNSAVGLSVIQMARAMGFKTISQVRREELIDPLKALGADHVVLEGSDWGKRVDKLIGGESIQLALNSIGGESAIDQIKVLGTGGTQITFGGMVGDLVRFPTRFLIFNDVRLIGFWWDQWSRQAGPEGHNEVMTSVYQMMRDGTLQLPIEAIYSLAKYKAALEHDKRPRVGKILLKP
ncbi:MAG: NADPH:quinone reductase-like Zn-dependent oxidoreductase [Lentimonas sp.]|jgi:NADPH:quinone reductase-like Zn-dependent oxidoreductase